MEFVRPFNYNNWPPYNKYIFEGSCEQSQWNYNKLRQLGSTPQQARAVLSTAIKTEIAITADSKEWAHIKKLRVGKAPHPDMNEIMEMVQWEELL